MAAQDAARQAAKPPRLYTDEEVRAAMMVGFGLGRAADGPPTDDERQAAVTEAMDLFAGGHGRIAPHYLMLKQLYEARDWRALAEAHIAAAHMHSSDAGPHALLALACVGRELLDELSHVGGILDARRG